MKVHDFNEQNAWSQAAGDEPFWDAVYQKAFPDMVSHMLSTGNTEAQHAGIDRIILLSNGKTVSVDEKKRSAVYNDILLEYKSNDKTDAPGWMEQPLRIDYLAYAFMPIQRVYLFPWLLLRRAWLHYGAGWKRKYQHVSANNGFYTTWSVAVPISVVRKAVGTAAIIEVSV